MRTGRKKDTHYLLLNESCFSKISSLLAYVFIEHTEETCSDKAAFVYLGGEVTAFYSSIIKLFMGSAGWACLVISFQWKKSNGKININRKEDFLYPDFGCFAIQKYLRTDIPLGQSESQYVNCHVSGSSQ